jgi:hypothetical protein
VPQRRVRDQRQDRRGQQRHRAANQQVRAGTGIGTASRCLNNASKPKPMASSPLEVIIASPHCSSEDRHVSSTVSWPCVKSAYTAEPVPPGSTAQSPSRPPAERNTESSSMNLPRIVRLDLVDGWNRVSDLRPGILLRTAVPVFASLSDDVLLTDCCGGRRASTAATLGGLSIPSNRRFLPKHQQHCMVVSATWSASWR